MAAACRSRMRNGSPWRANSSWLGCSWRHTSAPVSPTRRSRSPFLLPIATWLAHSAAHASVVAQQQMRVVVEPAAGHERRELGAQARRCSAGDEAGQLIGMRADIAQRSARAGARGIGLPLGATVARGFLRRGEPFLKVLHLHQPQRAQLARLSHGARQPDLRIGAVIVRQGEQPAGAGDGIGKVDRIGPCRGHRLVADDMEARFQAGPGRRVMEMIGRDDRDHVGAIFAARRLGPDQVAPVGIDPRRIEKGLLTGLARPRRIR